MVLVGIFGCGWESWGLEIVRYCGFVMMGAWDSVIVGWHVRMLFAGDDEMFRFAQHDMDIFMRVILCHCER